MQAFEGELLQSACMSSCKARPGCVHVKKLPQIFFEKEMAAMMLAVLGLTQGPIIRVCDRVNTRSTRQHRMCDQQLERLADLESALAAAVKGQDFSEAAALRDKLARLLMDSELAVLSANAEFYRAFSEGDSAAMKALWLPSESVVCVHPGHEPLVGSQAVLDSWREIFETKGSMSISASAVRCHLHAETVVRVTCIERIQPGEGRGMAATNLFERHSDGRWLMCLHQAGPIMV
jgi:ketosteroid isomerase-like protein